MGANTNSILKKCGEILINIKLKNRKTKMYTFSCVFCDANWDQLKKFSQHLEDTHLEQFIEETEDKPIICEPEIKLEEHGDTKKKDIHRKLLAHEKSTEDDDEEDVHQDPLEPIEFVTTTTAVIAEDAADVKVKHEKKEENVEDQYHEDDNDDDGDNDCGNNNDDMDYEDCTDDDIKETAKKKRTVRPRKSKKKCKDSSDVSSDDSNDSDFDISKEFGTPKKLQKNLDVIKKSRKSTTKNKTPKNKTKSQKSPPKPKVPKVYSESEKQLILSLFEAYEKQSFLWKKHERKRISDKSILEKAFETIANEVNEKLSTTLTGDLAKNLINKTRIEYSYEMEKQQKGEPHHILWYSEHLEFLKQNIVTAIKARESTRRGQIKIGLAELNDAYLSIIIELYKKNEPLWQTNDIRFGISEKRDEIFGHMIVDLKNHHNIDMTTDVLYEYIKYIHRLYTKDREQQLKCELAESKFTPSCEYYQEMYFLSESQGPFKCETCHEIVKGYERYHQHVANHSNTIPFKCSLCEMSFKKIDYLRLHMKRHLGINKFQCNFCDKGYPAKSELDWHMTSHTGEKPHLCQHCGASYRALHEYRNHVRRHEKRFRYECNICKHGFNHLHYYKDHMQSHLNIREHICNICGKAFNSVKYLKYHKLIHDNIKRYKCQICAKEFSQIAGLRQHRKQHETRSTSTKNKNNTDFSLFNLV